MLLSDLVRQGPRQLRPMQAAPYGDPRQMNNGTFLGALASGLTRGLQAYEQQKDDDRRKKAKGTIAQGLAQATAPAWTAPDDISMGEIRSAEEIEADPATQAALGMPTDLRGGGGVPSLSERVAGPVLVKAGQQTPTGYRRLSQILAGQIQADPEMADYLGDTAMMASMQALEQDRSDAMRQEERDWRQQIREEDRQWQVEDREAQRRFQQQLAAQQQAAARELAQFKASLEQSLQTGTFQGTGMDAQAWNIVIAASEGKLPVGSPQVQAAKAHLEQAKSQMTPQGLMTIPGADLSRFPGFGQAPPVNQGGALAGMSMVPGAGGGAAQQQAGAGAIPLPGGGSLTPVQTPEDQRAQASRERSIASQTEQVMSAAEQALTILENDSFFNPASGLLAAGAEFIPGSNANLISTQVEKLKALAAEIGLQMQKELTGSGAQFTDADARLKQAAAGLTGVSKSPEDQRAAIGSFRDAILDVRYGPDAGPPRLNIPPPAAFMSKSAAERFIDGLTDEELRRLPDVDKQRLNAAINGG